MTNALLKPTPRCQPRSMVTKYTPIKVMYATGATKYAREKVMCLDRLVSSKKNTACAKSTSIY